MWDDFLDILGTILMIILTVAAMGAFFWGIGILIIKMFNINYTWTFQHGILCFLGLCVIKIILKGIEKNKGEN